MCLYLVHLIQRLTGELIGRQASDVRRRRPSTFSQQNNSEASWPILIKLNVNHHWLGGLTALGLGAACIKMVVSMATYSLQNYNGKNIKKIFSKTT